MRKIILICLICFSYNVQAQTSDKQQLKDLIQNSFDDVFSNMDLEGLNKYYTDDFLLLEVGEVWDMERIKKELGSYNLKGSKRINNFKFIQVEVKGNTAWIAYHNNATFKKDGQNVGEMNWLESATAIKTKDGWKLEMLHSTRKDQFE